MEQIGSIDSLRDLNQSHALPASIGRGVSFPHENGMAVFSNKPSVTIIPVLETPQQPRSSKMSLLIKHYTSLKHEKRKL